MAAILKVYNATSEMRNPTPSVDAYLGLYSKKSEEQSRQFHPDPVWNDRGLELDYAWRRSLQQQEEQEQAAIYEISFWSSNYKKRLTVCPSGDLSVTGKLQAVIAMAYSLDKKVFLSKLQWW